MMRSTIATIFGTAALGLLKRKLGSNARRTPIVKKPFDQVEYSTPFAVRRGWEDDGIFIPTPELDGILYLHFLIREDLCYSEEWCCGIIYLIIDPNGKYANWNKDDKTYKELVKFLDPEHENHSNLEAIHNLVHEYTVQNNLDIEIEENCGYTNDIFLSKIDLLVDIHGKPIIKSGKDYDNSKLRKR